MPAECELRSALRHVLEEHAEGPLEHFHIAGHPRVGGYVHRPPLGRQPVLLRKRRQGAVHHGAELRALAAQIVAVLPQPLDGEVIVYQPTHAAQRAKARIDHLLRARPGAVRLIHPLEQVARPERRCQRVLDLVGDEPQILAPSSAGRGHPPNVVRSSGASKQASHRLYRLARLPILKFLPAGRHPAFLVGAARGGPARAIAQSGTSGTELAHVPSVAQRHQGRNRMQPATVPSSAGSLAMYLAEINRYPLLTVDEEQRLARLYAKNGDLDAAHKLVTSNLRFVVKVAYEYRSYGIKMADLIQEGNIGLMKAVQKFDADKGIRLISYAVWGIRAFIQNYILKSWSLVKLGTTQAQRKLFFSLARTRRELEKFDGTEQVGADEKAIARKLRVKPGEVIEMQQRMEGRDLSLDAPMGEDGGSTHVDFVTDGADLPDAELAEQEERHIVQERVIEALSRLDPRERYIIEMRVMQDKPMTLKELGEHFGFSRERARQLEIRAKAKLEAELGELMEDLFPSEDRLPVAESA